MLSLGSWQAVWVHSKFVCDLLKYLAYIHLNITTFPWLPSSFWCAYRIKNPSLSAQAKRANSAHLDLFKKKSCFYIQIFHSFLTRMACSQNKLPCPVLFSSSFPERTDTCGVLGFSPSRRNRFMLPTKLRPREGTKWLVYTSQEENLIPFSEHRADLDNRAETEGGHFGFN